MMRWIDHPESRVRVEDAKRHPEIARSVEDGVKERDQPGIRLCAFAIAQSSTSTGLPS